MVFFVSSFKNFQLTDSSFLFYRVKTALMMHVLHERDFKGVSVMGSLIMLTYVCIDRWKKIHENLEAKHSCLMNRALEELSMQINYLFNFLSICYKILKNVFRTLLRHARFFFLYCKT